MESITTNKRLAFFFCSVMVLGTVSLGPAAFEAEAASSRVGDVVRVPSGVSLTYTGELQTGIDEESAYNTSIAKGNKLYSVSGQYKATDAGTYTAVVSLVDKANHVWNDGTTSDKQVTWSIKKAELRLPSLRYDLVYTGKELTAVDREDTFNTLEFELNIASTIASAAKVSSLSGWSTANAKHASSLAGGTPVAEVQAAYDRAAAFDEALLEANSSKEAAQRVQEGYWTLQTITGASATDAGVYKAKAVLVDPANYHWEDTGSEPVLMKWYLLEAKQNLRVSAKQVTAKPGTAVSVLKVSGAKGAVRYRKKSGSTLLKVDKTTGKIKVANNAKKGTYKASIIVAAKGDKNHTSAQKVITVKIKVA